jgi:hypothetical protein
MTVYGHDHRNPRTATARIEDEMDKKGEGGGKGDQAGFYQIRVHGTQDGIEKDKLVYVPDLQSGAAHQKVGQFLPRQKGSIVQVQFDDQHQMSGHILGGYGTAGKGQGGGTVDGASGVDNKTNSYPQYSRGDLRQPTQIGWAKTEREAFRSDDDSFYEDIDTKREKTVPNGKRHSVAYNGKTDDQSYG